MARPIKQGLDYFPHDTDASNDPKIEAMEATFGLSGHAFYFKLLERIYRSANQCLDLSSSDAVKILARKFGTRPEKFKKMLEHAVNIGLFDEQKWSIAQQLTSNAITSRAEVVISHRAIVRNSYSKGGVSSEETSKKLVRNLSESTQSKVKESKVNIISPTPFNPPEVTPAATPSKNGDKISLSFTRRTSTF